MELEDVVMKLVGPIDPVGDASIDPERLENLKKLCILTDKLVGNINYVARQKDSHLGTVSNAGKYAHNSLEDIFAEWVPKPNENVTELLEVVKEFCERVDKGEVRSVKTYGKFKTILEKFNSHEETKN